MQRLNVMGRSPGGRLLRLGPDAFDRVEFEGIGRKVKGVQARVGRDEGLDQLNDLPHTYAPVHPVSVAGPGPGPAASSERGGPGDGGGSDPAAAHAAGQPGAPGRHRCPSLLAVPGLVSYVAKPALGALLILAGASSLKPGELVSIRRADPGAPTAQAASFQRGDGAGRVRPPVLRGRRNAPAAAARPRRRGERGSDPAAPRPQHGRRDLGGRADRLCRGTAKGKWPALPEGISRAVHDQLARTGKLRLEGPVRVFEATDVRGESTHAAYQAAQSWRVSQTQSNSAADYDADRRTDS